jgi:hypothetical protein
MMALQATTYSYCGLINQTHELSRIYLIILQSTDFFFEVFSKVKPEEGRRAGSSIFVGSLKIGKYLVC